ncbi:MAG: MBL fold metallo-hydrolase [Candidatus Promineifilaceae bacterium]
MRVRFWGVRGTIPSPGPDTVKVGGNTACIDLFTSDQQLIILDAGSGIRRLGKALLAEHPHRIMGTLLFSHTHWDHIQGFPFFVPAFIRNNRFVVIGQKKIGQKLENVLADQVVQPYLPFGYKALEADLIVKEIHDSERMIIGDDTVVQAQELDHPGGCLGFRIENRDTVFTYCTDTTHPFDKLNENVLKLAKNADLLVHDAQYTPEQKALYPTYGHSSWMDAAKAACAANVKALALFHHDPDTSDDALQTSLAAAREIFPNTFLAQEGLELTLPLEHAVPDIQ